MSRNKNNNFAAKAKLAIVASVIALTGATAIADVLNPTIGNLLYEENFDTLNSAVWNAVEGDGCGIGLCGWGNQELEYYRANNLSIDDVPFEPGTKALALQARREAFGGKEFTSGKVSTDGKLQVKYGMVEFRVSTPQIGTGLWPAGWMLGTSLATWPAKGEIDIMEMGHKASSMVYPGSNVNSYTASNVIFWASGACVPANPSCAASTAWQTLNAYVAGTPLINRFVIYRLYWTESEMRFTVIDNGVEHDMYANPIAITEEATELQAPFYFLFNLAVGGNFTDAANGSQVTAPLPGKMYIDYLRVYQLDGKGEVKLGNQTPKETGTFGVFSDATTTNKQELGASADLWVWNQTSIAPGTSPAYEGSNVIAWNYTAPQWFGAGIASRQVHDMSNFGNGSLKFRIKIPANVGFKIGIADTYTNEKWLNFPANTTAYGLVRTGDWAQATIPISEIRGINALQSMSQLFMIASIDPQPSANFALAIDDIVWDCGTDAACLSSGSSSTSSASSNDATNNPSSVAHSSIGQSSVGGTASSAGASSVVAASSAVASSSRSASSVGSSSSSVSSAFEWLVQAENFVATSGVQVVNTMDFGGGYNVDGVTAGNWMAFAGLNVPSAGAYQIEYRVASTLGSQLSSDLNGGSIQLGNVNIPATGGSQIWTTVTQNVTLNAGSFSFGIYAQQGGWSLNWFRITKVDTPSSSSSVASSVTSSLAASSLVSASASSASSEYGYTVLSSTSVQFYVNNAAWVDVHYTINNGGQENVRTTHNADNSNTFIVTGIPAGAVVKYFFTVGPLVGGAFDSPWQTFTMGAAASSVTASSVAASSVTSSMLATSSASSASSEYGYTLVSDTSVQFYVNNASWVDVHYIINNGGQQNVRTTHNADNSNTFVVSGIPAGAVVKYFFTVGPLVGGAYDSPWGEFIMGSSVSSSSSSVAVSSTAHSSSSIAPLVCDFNGSRSVDLDDIDMILARKNTAAQGSNDPYDLNHDNVINILDARACVLKCTKAACAR